MNHTLPAKQTGAVDFQRAMERAGDSPETLAELAEIFLDQAKPATQAVRRAAEARDGAALKQAAHLLKGSLKLFTADGAGEAAQRVEDLGADARFDEVDEAVERLAREVDAVVAELRDFVERVHPFAGPG